MKSLSRVQLFVTPWTVAYQAPQSLEFSRQEYWSGLPFPSPGDLPYLRIESGSPALQADTLPSEPTAAVAAVSSLSRVQFFCNSMDYSPPGFFVHGILQARILEWVDISFSRGSSWSRDWTCIPCLAGGFFASEPPGKPNPILQMVKPRLGI